MNGEKSDPSEASETIDAFLNTCTLKRKISERKMGLEIISFYHKYPLVLLTETFFVTEEHSFKCLLRTGLAVGYEFLKTLPFLSPIIHMYSVLA